MEGRRMTAAALASSYLFHGFEISVSSGERVAEALRARLLHFPPGGGAEPRLRFDYLSVSSADGHEVERPRGPGRPVEDLPSGEISYFPAEDKLFMAYGDDVRALCDLGRSRSTFSVVDSGPDYSWLVTHFLFTCALTELLKRRGLFCLHAAALSIGGRALLLPGTSGSGKSTLSVALARAGFDFLGDDMLFLTRGEAGLVRALAWPDEVDVADETIALFPELRPLAEAPVPPGYYKRQFRPEDVFATRVAFEATPVALVFPSVAHAETSVLTPIPQAEALLELVPNVLLTEGRSTQAHLDVFGALSRQCACYRLETGRDLDALPDLLRGLAAAGGRTSPDRV
jgi:hypothetical protein